MTYEEDPESLACAECCTGEALHKGKSGQTAIGDYRSDNHARQWALHCMGWPDNSMVTRRIRSCGAPLHRFVACKSQKLLLLHLYCYQ